MAKSDNLERENRILDVAAELFIRYGFDKTAVNEIARGAGVSQGTIYLHFESKDALMETLLIREMEAYADRCLALMEADPEGGTLSNLYKISLYGIQASPFMLALMRDGSRIMGSYLLKRDSIFQADQFKMQRADFTQKMQDAGVVRRDLDAKIVAHIMSMLSYGLISMDQIMDPADIPPLEAVIDGLAYMMDRALTPDDGGDREAGKVIIRELIGESRQILADLKRERKDASDEP
jgi:TetR/AcrR family acrAB operon transcriptional repressor